LACVPSAISSSRDIALNCERPVVGLVEQAGSTSAANSTNKVDNEEGSQTRGIEA
jgi:hypothetical protein